MIHSFHIIGSRQLGGAEQFYMRLIVALNEHDHKAVALTRPTSPLCSALNEKIRQIHVPMRNGWDIFSVLAIRRFIQKEKPEIVQTYMGRATRLTRMPRHSKAIHVARLGGYYKIKGYYEHAQAWVGNTRGICDYLICNGMPASRVYHIGNFVEVMQPSPAGNLDSIRRSLNIPGDAINIISLGRFNYKKGFEDLLDAFARLPIAAHGRPLYLLIAGDGPLRQALHSQAVGLGIHERIRWLGWQDDPGIYYDLADVFVCPSRQETLGNVILEAWAHQLPVISTRTPGPLELIKDGENGLLVPCHDPQMLGERLLELLLGEHSIWQHLSANGIRALIANHSKEAVVNAYLEMYEELEGKRP
jgi:glycosyltransferase involved in cell wall biosynthesis